MGFQAPGTVLSSDFAGRQNLPSNARGLTYNYHPTFPTNGLLPTSMQAPSLLSGDILAFEGLTSMLKERESKIQNYEEQLRYCQEHLRHCYAIIQDRDVTIVPLQQELVEERDMQ